MISAPPLVPYGIHSENSTIRAHVCVIVQRVYVFETKAAREAIALYPDTPKALAFQSGVLGRTADGYKMPWQKIPRIRELNCSLWSGWASFTSELSLADKGAKAVECVVDIMRIGYFPFWICAEEAADSQIQVNGADIIVHQKHLVQVKCDYKGGAKEYGGTGNLYIQTDECNPYGIH